MSIRVPKRLLRKPALQVAHILCMAACCALPLLTGCLTRQTLSAVHRPTEHSLYDRIDQVHKVVLKDHTLLMFLEGHFTNSPAKTRFTLTIPLTTIQMYAAVSDFPEYGSLKVSRDAISTGWAPEIRPDDNYIAIPIGPALHQDGYPDDYPWERPVIYTKSASFLPNATRTIYPLFEYDNGMAHVGDHLAMEFVYLDAGEKPACKIIYVDQVRGRKTKHGAYYCLLPLTIPLDIAFSPVYLGMYIYLIARGVHM